MRTLNLVAALVVMAGPAFAQDLMLQGDAAAGEEQFNRQCVACHVVQNEAGDVLAGRNGKTGPNLFNLPGRHAGSVEDFRYGDSMKALGEAGAIWTEANFVGYVQDPTGWLRTKLDDRRARGKMAYQVREEKQALDLYAYLASFEDPAELKARLDEGMSNPLNQ